MKVHAFFCGIPPEDTRAVQAVRDIEGSGLTPEAVALEGGGLFAGTSEDLASDLNITPEHGVAVMTGRTLIRFPYFDQAGEVQTVRYKFIPPLTWEGKEVKYLSPKGASVSVYVLRTTWSVLDDPSIPLWITEGEKKTIKLKQYGVVPIGLPGVTCFRDKPMEDSDVSHRELHPVLRKIKWNGRVVMIAFDADFRDNQNVLNAMVELAIRLRMAGGDVRIVQWNPDCGKGIDDVLAASDNPEAALSEMTSRASPLKSFIEPKHADAVVHALAVIEKSATSLEVAAKEIAPLLGTKPKTLVDDVRRRQTQQLRARKSARLAEISSIDEIYTAKDGTLQRCKDGKTYHLADFEARITAVAVHETQGQIYTVTGNNNLGNPFTIKISAENFTDPKILRSSLEQAIGPTASCSANALAHLGPAIKRLSDLEHVKHTSVYSRTGWVGNRFLIPGNPIDGIEVDLGNRKMVYATPDEIDLTLGREALSALMKSQAPEVTTVILTFLLQAPLGRLVGWEDDRYCLFVCGRTGSLKTSTVQVMMCIWGSKFISEDSLIKWGEGTTRNALMRLATIPCDLPLFIDNYKPNTGSGSRDFVNVIHNILEGGEKDRLTKTSELRDSKTVSCWPICTGEDVPDNDSASLARSLVIRMKRPEGAGTEELTLAQELSKHLPSIGCIIIRYLETVSEDDSARSILRETFIKYRKVWMDYLTSNYRKMVNIPRVASNLASNQLSWEFICQIPELAPVLYPLMDAHKAGLHAIATEMARSTTESNEAERYLETLRDLISRNQLTITASRKSAETLLKSGTSPLIGWWEPDQSLCICNESVLSEISKSHRNSITVSIHTLNKQLEERGAIASHDAGRLTKTCNLGGRTLRVLHLKASVVKYEAPAAEQPSSDPFDTGTSTTVPY